MEVKPEEFSDIFDSTRCLLCHETTNELIAVTDGPEVNFVAILCRHFWFSSESIRYQSVCKKCWSCVDEFHQFYMEVVQLYTSHANMETLSVEKHEFIELETRLEEPLETAEIKWQLETPKEGAPDDDSHTKISNIELVEKDQFFIQGEPAIEDTKQSYDPLDVPEENNETANESDGGDKSDTKNSIENEAFIDINMGDFVISNHTELKCPSCDFLASTFTNIRKHMRSIHNEEGYVVCCGLNFSKRTRLLEHVVRTANPNAFSCKVCNTAFAGHVSLNKHISKFHNQSDEAEGKEVVECEQCDLSFDRKSQLNVHLNTHDSNQQVKICLCPECPKSFPSKARLKDHIQRIHGQENVVCDKCPKRFNTTAQLQVHQKSIHNIAEIKKKQCNVCNRWLVAGGLRKHMLIHQTSDKPNICTICGKIYPNASALYSHTMFVHRKEKNFRCAICKKSFKLATGLENHMLKFHSPLEQSTERDLLKCDQCDRSFDEKSQFDVHLKTHDSNLQAENVPCPECPKSFQNKARLKDHIQRVHGPDNIVCDKCPKRFKTMAQFQYHRNSRHNTDEVKRQQCKVCNRWLKGAGGLRKHMLIHQTSGKPNICTICGKNAPNAIALKSHMIFVHLKQRSFECTVCGKAFKLAKLLEEHMTTHTGNILYTCAHCPKTFNSHANMLAHRKRDHLEEWKKIRMEREKRYECPSSSA